MDSKRALCEPYEPHVIERKWQERWSESALFRTPDADDRPTFYCLDFFPYPSGAGLSVGHCRNYVPTDVVSRFHRMKGFAVLHPMGWDAFGLPAENEAIDKRVHPRDSTSWYAANYRRQMSLIGASYDWEREINSSQPDYYRWTQWIFLLLYERGLAYQAMAPVNWCPTCQTTLANEEIELGTCWRCHQPVVHRDLKQWFFRITAYADELLSAMDSLDWPEHILTMQRNWIGRSEGFEFEMRVARHEDATLRVFTTRIDTIHGMTFVVISPEHPLVQEIVSEEQRPMVERYLARARETTEIERLNAQRNHDGVFVGAFSVNPANQEQVPIFVADYVLDSYGTGAIMAVPAHDRRDYEFALRYGLPIVEVIQPERPVQGGVFEGNGTMINSGDYDGLSSEVARVQIAFDLEARGMGQMAVQYRMRDWLISRQRYWGAPIPIVHCMHCGATPIPDSALPILLPHLPDYLPRGDGRSPLSNIPEFVRTSCPACGGPAQRETDTMGGFACSSWYFLRFVDPWYRAGPLNPEAVRRWLPVDLYVGGAEHAVMHLLYARFWTKVLADAGLLEFREPFPRLKSQGIVHASDGKRMSKSRGNVVTPDDVVERHGADVLRIHLLFMAPFDRNVSWDESGIAGAERFLQRVWRICTNTSPTAHKRCNSASTKTEETSLRAKMHKTIKQVTDDLESFKFNTAIATLMEFSNELSAAMDTNMPATVINEACEVMLKLLAPFAPHITEELWERCGETYSIHQAAWPEHDPSYVLDETVTLIVQVNGKVRARIQLPRGLDESEAVQRALDNEKIQLHLDARSPKRVITVRDSLINFVI